MTLILYNNTKPCPNEGNQFPLQAECPPVAQEKLQTVFLSSTAPKPLEISCAFQSKFARLPTEDVSACDSPMLHNVSPLKDAFDECLVVEAFHARRYSLQIHLQQRNHKMRNRGEVPQVWEHGPIGEPGPMHRALHIQRGERIEERGLRMVTRRIFRLIGLQPWRKSGRACCPDAQRQS